MRKLMNMMWSEGDVGRNIWLGVLFVVVMVAAGILGAGPFAHNF